MVTKIELEAKKLKTKVSDDVRKLTEMGEFRATFPTYRIYWYSFQYLLRKNTKTENARKYPKTPEYLKMPKFHEIYFTPWKKWAKKWYSLICENFRRWPKIREDERKWPNFGKYFGFIKLIEIISIIWRKWTEIRIRRKYPTESEKVRRWAKNTRLRSNFMHLRECVEILWINFEKNWTIESILVVEKIRL